MCAGGLWVLSERWVDGSVGHRANACSGLAANLGMLPNHSSGVTESALWYLDLVLAQVRVQGWMYV